MNDEHVSHYIVLNISPLLSPVMVAHPPCKAVWACKCGIALLVEDKFFLVDQSLGDDEWRHCQAVKLLNQVYMYRAKIAMYIAKQSNC